MPTLVLIVEDSPTQAEALASLLVPAGYEVRVARDGEEGLVLFEQSRPDVVLSDIVMPGKVDGYELCRRIKRAAGRETPVVLLTSLSNPMDIISGLECGADNFVTKPYDEAHLLERLQVLLATREARSRKAAGKVRVGVTIYFMGREFTIRSGREQILDLLITTFEEAVRHNQALRQREAELMKTKAELSKYLAIATGEWHAAEEKYRRIFEGATFGLFQATPAGLILDANPALARILGYDAPDALAGGEAGPAGRRFLQSPYHEQLASLIARDGEVSGFEAELRRHDGKTIWVRVSARAVRDGAGAVDHIDGVMEDITRAKLLEAQLVQAQKMESVGRLAGGVAHDFNNMLTVILTNAQLVVPVLSDDHPARDELEEIRAAAERAAALTRQLLSFARRHHVEPQVLDLNALTLNMDRMLRRLIGEDIELVTILEPQLSAVRADPGQIEQVLVNLVVNARDAMPNGGKLTIETANVTLDEDYARTHLGVTPGRYVLLAVSDTGHGIPDDVRAHLFEPFFTTKAEGEGTGLGLATCFGIVTQSGGTIWPYSEPGHGTTFKVYLPAVAEPAAHHARGDRLDLPGGTETVLVVEDERLVRAVTVRTLSTLGYRVLEAADGTEALRIAAGEPDRIHLLMTDVVMPQIGGWELAQRIRETRPDVAVLFTSGYSDRAVVRHGMLGEAASFLQKPFVPETLARKVRDVLDASRST